jgi:hypothetical protein
MRNIKPNKPLSGEALRRLIGAPAQRAPVIKWATYLILKDVLAGDTYRRVVGGRRAREARTRSLHRLFKLGLVRRTREGFWRVTHAGLQAMDAHRNR